MHIKSLLNPIFLLGDNMYCCLVTKRMPMPYALPLHMLVIYVRMHCMHMRLDLPVTSERQALNPRCRGKLIHTPLPAPTLTSPPSVPTSTTANFCGVSFHALADLGRSEPDTMKLDVETCSHQTSVLPLLGQHYVVPSTWHSTFSNCNFSIRP